MQLNLSRLSPDVRERFTQSYQQLAAAAAAHTQGVEFGRLDASQYTRLVNTTPSFFELISQGMDQVPHFDDLLADLFFGLYLYDPRFREASELRPTHQRNHQLLSAARNLSSWQEARALATMDERGALFGLIAMAQTLLAELPAQEPPPDPQELLDQLSDPESDEQAEQLMDQMAQCQQGEAGDADKLRRVMRKSLDTAHQEMQESHELLAQWGVSPGEFSALDPMEAMRLYKEMRSLPNVRKLADQLGRMRSVMHEAQLRPESREIQEIVDVHTSMSLLEALPNERIALTDDDLQWVFWAKLAQHSLLSWAYAGRDSAGKGPFILCVDVSGSTTGDPERWGKGFVLACLEMAARERRDAAVIFFDAVVHPDGVFTFPGGTATLADKIKLAQYFTGGGTDFMQPLEIALSNIEQTDGDWASADIVLVTDGEAPLEDAWLAQYKTRCQAKSVRTYGVALDIHPSAIDTLKRVCDQAVAVRSLSGADAARPLFDFLTAR